MKRAWYRDEDYENIIRLDGSRTTITTKFDDIGKSLLKFERIKPYYIKASDAANNMAKWGSNYDSSSHIFISTAWK